MAAFIALIVSYLIGPLVKAATFFASRGGTLLVAGTTFVGLLASLYSLVTSNAASINSYVSPVVQAAQSMQAYIQDSSSLSQAVMYYTACDQLYLAFSTFATSCLAVLGAALLVAVSLLFAAVLPVLITHITSYAVRHITS